MDIWTESVGAIISAHATPLRLQISEGSFYVDAKAFTLPESNTFYVWYKTGGTWTISTELTLFSDVFDGGTSAVYNYYQNGDNIAELSGVNYAVYWIFLCPEGELYVLLGEGSYPNIGATETAEVPSSLPMYLTGWGILVGRVILQKGGAAFYSVESIYRQSFTLSATVDHNSTTNLTTGDVHTQYAFLAGRSGGQTLIGGTDAGDDLTLQSTSNGTKGSLLFGASGYDEVNNRLGIGIAAPLYKTHIYAAASGATASSSLSELVIESNTETGLTILTPSANTGYVGFADPGSTLAGGVSYSHNSDLLSLWAGNNPRVHVSSSGKFLIGNSTEQTFSSSNSSLQIKGIDAGSTAFSTGRWSADANGPAYYFGKSRGVAVGDNTVVQSGDIMGAIIAVGNDGTDMVTQSAGIIFSVDGAAGSNSIPGNIRFLTATAGAGNYAERVRINSVGYMGILTTDPSAPLTVKGTSAPQTVFDVIGYNDNELVAFVTDSSENGAIRLRDGSQNIDVYINSSGNTWFNGGNVGIGTNVPGNLLHLVSADGPFIELERVDASIETDDVLGSFGFGGTDDVSAITANISAVAGSDWTGTSAETYLAFVTTPSGSIVKGEKMRLTGQGLLGINTTSPSQLLTINQNSGNAIIEVTSYSNTSTHLGAINLGHARGSGAGPTATQSGDFLGGIYFRGWDTDLSSGAAIFGVASAEWGTSGDTTDSPTDVIIYTCANGSSNLLERLKITSNGNITIGESVTPAGLLTIEKSLDSGGVTNAPWIQLNNTSSGGTYSFSGFGFEAHNGDLTFDMFADGTGFFTAADRCVYFRLNEAYPIIFGTAAIKQLQISGTGQLSSGNEEAPDVSRGGLCLNQGTNDDNILTFKSSDVTHGMTTLAETDTYCYMRKISASPGGLYVAGFTGATRAFLILGCATTDDTTTTTGSDAVIEVFSGLKSGTTITSNASTANIFGIKNGGSSKVLVKGNGNVEADGTVTSNSYDFAEYFESESGESILNGTPVVLEADKIRPALDDEIPFGVISATACFIGNQGLGWQKRYLIDNFGAPIMEDIQWVKWEEEICIVEAVEESENVETQDSVYKMITQQWKIEDLEEGFEIPENAEYYTTQDRVLNPDYNPEIEFTPRYERPEWNIVGLLGQVYIRKGSPINPNWIFLKEANEEADLYLIK